MQNASLKLAALAGVVGIGFVVVLQAQRGITQPVTRQEEQPTGQVVAEQQQTSQQGGDQNTEQAFPDSAIPIEQSEPVIDDNHSPTVSEETSRPNISDALPQLAEDDLFQPFPSETSDEQQSSNGTTPEFSGTGSPVQTAGFADATTGNTGDGNNQATVAENASDTPRPLFDLSPAESNETGSPRAIELLPVENAASTSAEGNNGFENQNNPDETPQSMPAGEPDPFSPFETTEQTTETPAQSETGNEDRSNPFFNAQQQSQQQPEPQNTPQQNQTNDLEQARPLFDVAPKTPEKNEFFPDEEINTGGLKPSAERNDADSGTSPSSPFSTGKRESLDSTDPDLSTVPTTTNQSALETESPEPAPVSEGPSFNRTEQTQETPAFPVFPDTTTSTSPENSNPSQTQDTVQQTTPPEPEKEFPGDGTVDGKAPSGSQQPQLKIEKNAPPNAVLGQPMIYSIIVKNIGDRAAHQVVVEDQIPKGTELTGTIPQAVLSGKRLSWKFGTFEPGEQKTIRVRVIPREVGQVGSVATVHFFSEVAAETIVKAPELELSFSGPPRAKLGEPVVYRFKVTNTGNKEAKKVYIRDIVPEGLTHPESNDLEYLVGTLPAGKSEEIELTLTAARPGTIVNRAVVTAEGGVKIEKSASLEVLSSPIILSRTGPKKRYVGRQTEFVNLVTNDSDRSVEETTVKEIVPVGMRFVEATSDGKYDPGSRTVTWSIDRLGPKQSQELRVKLIPTDVGTPQSVVQAVDSDGMKTVAVSQTTIEGFAAINVDVASPGQPVGVGENLTFRIVARNRGTAAAGNLQVKVVLPDELEFISAQGPGRHEHKENEIRFQPIGQVGRGKQATFMVTLTARKNGDARLRAEIDADHLSQPLVRDEAILILP